jgi:hypothetical protein
VVIETCDFELELSDRVWEMDEDSEQAQKLANMQAMRDFMNALVRRIEPAGDRRIDKGEEEDEFQSEGVGDGRKYRIPMKEAFAMGGTDFALWRMAARRRRGG